MQRIRRSTIQLDEEDYFFVNHKPITGVLYELYKSGQLRYEKTIEKSLLQGSYKVWHENGHLQEDGWFERGKKEGVWKEYYPSGKLKRETNYQHSSIDYQKLWNETGVLIEELKTDLLENFKNTKATLKRWYDSGELKEELEAEYGLVMDKKEWDKTGTLINHYTFTSLDENTLYI